MKRKSCRKVVAIVLMVAMVFTCVPGGIWSTGNAQASDKTDVKTSNQTETTVDKPIDTPDGDAAVTPGETVTPEEGETVTPEGGESVAPEEGESVAPEEGENQEDNNLATGAGISLSGDRFLYTGKEIRPAVKVIYKERKLAEGADYKLKYINNLYPGTATVEITGTGQYKGVASATYKIYIPNSRFTGIYTHDHQVIRIEWSKVKGVDGYLIYKSTSENGKYTCVRNASPKYDEWLDKKVYAGKTYYYKMRTYKKINGKYYYSEYTLPRAKKIRLLAPAKVRAVCKTYTSINITWTKVKGATGYIIYRSNRKDGTYKKIKTVPGYSTTSYVNGGLVTGTRYFYKVAAYKSNTGNPGLISRVTYTTPHVATVQFDKSRIKKYRTAIKLAWHRVPGASGYRIYKYSKKTKKYEYVKFAPANTSSWTDKHLSVGGHYYYKIRAYKKINGVRYFGYTSKYYKRVTTGWVYSGSYKLYYSKKGNLVKDLRKIIKPQSRYVIRVNKKMNVVTVYAKDGNNGYIIPVVSFRCSAGHPTPVGTFYTPAKYRWLRLLGPSWGQWCTGIKGDFLFHSVYYMKKNNNKTLPVATYNRLGHTESHGCVRLRAGDAKWIYDHCRVGTKVVIYNSNYAGPYGKPSLSKLPYWHTWDPTDPTAYKYCRAHHCHGR